MKKDDISMGVFYTGVACLLIGTIAVVGVATYRRIIAAYERYGSIGDFVLTCILIGFSLVAIGLISAIFTDPMKEKR